MAQTKKPPTKSKTVARASGSSKPVKRNTSSPRSDSSATTSKAKIDSTPTYSKNLNNEVIGILTITVAILLCLALIFETSGLIGTFVRGILLGLFGKASFVAVFMLFWIGISTFLSRTSKSSYKYWLLIFAVAFSSIIIHLSQYDSLTDNTTLSGMYEWAQSGIGGGLVGGGVANVLVRLIAIPGAWILSISGVLITVILITGISVQIIATKIFSRLKTRTQELKQNMVKSHETQHQSASSQSLRQPEAENSVKLDGALTHFPIEENDPLEHYGPVEPTYFEGYFTDNQSTPAADNTSKQSSQENRRRTRQSTVNTMPENVQPSAKTDEPARFTLNIDNIKEITAYTINEDGEIVPNKPDDGLFEPPSEVQTREKLDLATQAALDSGIPMDEAISAGKRGITLEIEESTIIPVDNTPIPNYKLPPISLLSHPEKRRQSPMELKAELEYKANKLLDTLSSFGVQAAIQNVVQGPTVTRFELNPGLGVKVNKITNLSEDIALSLAASGIIIAPISGKSVIGVEIPNEKPYPVSVREVIDTQDFQNFSSKTAFALGKDITGSTVIADIAKMPHLLVAGATGSGKSVCINSLVTSILYKAKPNEVKLIMIDPKMVELAVYNGIPHLLIPVVTDPKRAAGALNWAVIEMDNRYRLFETNKCRNLAGFNEMMAKMGQEHLCLPEIIIIIDELADLMMVARSDVESSISRLAAKARAAGMYLVIATQRPSVDVITGVIKANVPSRISFAVSSQIDSRTILDSQGAEKLLGKGDMLYYPYGAAKPTRIQGNFVSDNDVERVVEYVKGQHDVTYDEEIIEQIENINESQHYDDPEDNRGNADELLPKAIEMAIENSQASVAMLQRRFKIGYQRAARIIDQMEERRIIGPYEGTKPRQVLITRAEFLEMSASNDW